VNWKARVAAMAVLLTSYVAMGDMIMAELAGVLLVVAAVAAWRFVDGFWRIVVSGFVGGAAAGLLILGPGFRLAMRAVAIMDPVHPEEFSVEGTLFIVIGLGAIMGGVTGSTAHLVRRALAIDSAVVSGTLLAALEMAILTFLSGELSRELFALGISAWFNIPLFALFTLGYGIAAMALADKAEAAMLSRSDSRGAKVPA
jgi:hypothetical protein